MWNCSSQHTPEEQQYWIDKPLKYQRNKDCRRGKNCKNLYYCNFYHPNSDKDSWDDWKLPDQQEALDGIFKKQKEENEQKKTYVQKINGLRVKWRKIQALEKKAKLKLEEKYVQKMKASKSQLKNPWIFSKQKPFFRLKLVNQMGLSQKCNFCQEQFCKNCDLYITDHYDIRHFIDQIPAGQPLQIEIWFENPKKFIDLSNFNNFTCFNDTAAKIYQKPIKIKKEITEQEQVTLTHCLKRLQETEKLGELNEWFCEKCQENQQAQKQMKIFKGGNVLIFQLKRFKYQQGNELAGPNKIDEFVSFPLEELNLNEFIENKELPNEVIIHEGKLPFIVGGISSEELKQEDQNENKQPLKEEEESSSSVILPSIDEQIDIDIYPIVEEQKEEVIKCEFLLEYKEQDIIYDLYAVVNHIGSLQAGHYYTYAYNQAKKQWFEYNDSLVTPIGKSKVVTSAAYILFYKRKDTPVINIFENSYGLTKFQDHLSHKVALPDEEVEKENLPVGQQNFNQDVSMTAGLAGAQDDNNVSNVNQDGDSAIGCVTDFQGSV